MGVTATPLPGAAGVPPAVVNVNRPGSISPVDAINSYRAVVVGGRIDWTSDWAQRLLAYVRNGGVVMLNAAQTKGLPGELLGVRLLGVTAEAHNARCLSPGEPAQDLSGQIFRYERVERQGSEVLIETTSGDPLVTINKVGRGKVIFCAVPDLLGEDERMTPLAAHLLTHLFADATPLRVEGDVEHLINRTSSGWVVTLINNNGVYKPQQGLAQVDRSASVTATITWKGEPISRATEWTTNQTLNITQQADLTNTVTVTIAPGGIAIVELPLRN
jgi:hypothetical protein